MISITDEYEYSICIIKYIDVVGSLHSVRYKMYVIASIDRAAITLKKLPVVRCGGK
jgi:hypothetical protein